MNKLRRIFTLLMIVGMVFCMACKGPGEDPAASKEKTESAPATTASPKSTEREEPSSAPETETAEIETTAEITTEAPDPEGPVSLISRGDWDKRVKQALIDFVTLYGKYSKNYPENHYVVFDFDNTCAIFDIEQQLALFQLETMAFHMGPDRLREVLWTGLSDGGYAPVIEDIVTAYGTLEKTYGPFAGEMLPENKREILKNDPIWQEFAVKMLRLYQMVSGNETEDTELLFPLYWFTGMTYEQAYKTSAASCIYYAGKETSDFQMTSPDIPSNSGRISVSWRRGLTVTENIRELFRMLYDNGIDIYVCSASGSPEIQAAIDVFGLHDYCTGMIGVNAKQKDGIFVNEPETDAHWFLTTENGWQESKLPGVTVPYKAKKTACIENGLVPQYGGGPLAGFMDSTGDFSFCSEFASLKLVTVFNRANRGVTDGGGLASVLALYEQEIYPDLQAANDAGDTLYVLQGRDENGYRCFRNSAETVVFGSSTPRLLKNEENEAMLSYISKNRMSVKDAVNAFARPVSLGAAGNLLGFSYGFQADYGGYHRIR